MWLSSRRLLFFAPLALFACGFAPVYGPGGAAEGLQGAIRLADPTDKASFDLVRFLELNLGRAEAARFDLSYAISTETVGVGITSDGAITRYNLVGSVQYSLAAQGSGAVVTSGSVQSFTAYSATGSTVAGLAAETDAQERLMRILADQIAARLLATSADWLR